MSNRNKEISEYLESSKTVLLATVDSDNTPNVRTLGGFGIDGVTVYFSTAKESGKVEQIENNNSVSLLFQHENQVIPNFVNVEVKGIAEELKCKEKFEEGFKYILKRKPQSKVTKETHNIYKVVAKEIKVLDFSKEKAEEKIEKIKF